MKKIALLLGLLMTHFSFAEPSNPIRVLVVGAGPSGLSVAKALQNKGIYPDVIEKEEQIRSEGAGIAIPANGSWALSKLGVDLAAKALVIPKMQFTDEGGDLLVEETIDKIHPDGEQFYALSRKELMDLLLSSLSEKIRVEKSVTVKNFHEENDLVHIEFSNGKVKSYDLVIGCDGVHSTLRSRVHPNESPEFLGLFVWRAMMGPPFTISMPTYMLGSDRALLLYPMPNGKTYVYGHVFQDVKHLSLESFSQAFSTFGGQVPDLFSNMSQLPEVKFHTHHMEKSHSVRFILDGFNRVLLVGDAAHAFGPMLQNGAAQAFEDAYVLQELLSDDMRAGQVPSLIEAFKNRRDLRVQNIFNMSNVKIKALSDPQQIQGRNEAIRKSGAPNVNGFKLIMQQNP